MTKLANINPDSERHWANSFLLDLLTHWNVALTDQSGLFHPDFDQHWTPQPSDRPLTLVSQCRLIHTMSIGFALTQDSSYLEIVRNGLGALEQYFRLGPEPHYCWSVNHDGTPDVEDINAYGYAFVILAQATAASVTEDQNLAVSAFQTWNYMRKSLADEYGGLKWHRPINRPSIPIDANSQNPLMHTFEALIALARCSSASSDIKTSALDSAHVLLGFISELHGFQEGRLIEWFTPDWKPQPATDGGFIDLGHCFEWAFLLSEWYTLTDDKSALNTGRRFLNTAIELGVNPNGDISANAYPDGTVVAAPNGLWPQCEAVRALHRYAVDHKMTTAADIYPKTLDYYKSMFVDPQYGGVYAGPISDGVCVSKHKGDGWKLDYHSVNMLLELK